MLIMDQRTMQIMYRIPTSEIIRLSLSPYLYDIAVFHVKAVRLSNKIRKSELQKLENQNIGIIPCTY